MPYNYISAAATVSRPPTEPDEATFALGMSDYEEENDMRGLTQRDPETQDSDSDSSLEPPVLSPQMFLNEHENDTGLYSSYVFFFYIRGCLIVCCYLYF